MARRGENIHKRKDGRWEGRYIKARTPDSCGEDTLFLKELIEKGLKLYKSPIRIASVDMSDSTWFKGYNEKYFKDKGALIEAAYPRISGLLAILQSVRNSKK